ncbi:MAG: hypothetical protein CRN43_06795 [Candidatus Nephrothrix sp. EaCA]|nr:MAG: hypothetical protein CRN43_06795 [Candidatus Nephrothrix sp. EaCA]
MPIRSKYLNGHTNELFSGKAELSLPRSFPAKAFKYLNRRANEFFSGKAESAASFFGGLAYPNGLL